MVVVVNHVRRNPCSVYDQSIAGKDVISPILNMNKLQTIVLLVGVVAIAHAEVIPFENCKESGE